MENPVIIKADEGEYKPIISFVSNNDVKFSINLVNMFLCKFRRPRLR